MAVCDLFLSESVFERTRFVFAPLPAPLISDPCFNFFLIATRQVHGYERALPDLGGAPSLTSKLCLLPEGFVDTVVHAGAQAMIRLKVNYYTDINRNIRCFKSC